MAAVEAPKIRCDHAAPGVAPPRPSRGWGALIDGGRGGAQGRGGGALAPDPGSDSREEASRCPRLPAGMGGNFGRVAVGLRAAECGTSQSGKPTVYPLPQKCLQFSLTQILGEWVGMTWLKNHLAPNEKIYGIAKVRTRSSSRDLKQFSPVTGIRSLCLFPSLPLSPQYENFFL